MPHRLEATIMARQQAARALVDRNRSGAPEVARQPSTLIQFDPPLAVRAIVFHLIDEGITERVADDSVQATLVRLTRGSLAPTIEQWMWSEMSHAARLQWLLEKTHTSARLVSEVLSVLEPSRA
jgi:hypothetical protein